MSNIQVVVRCRGRNPREVESKSPIIIDIPEDAASSITVNYEQHPTEFLNSINSKTYTVDQAYGPTTDQSAIYSQVALPLFNDFMNGYNVTILAYGQTGTGKTYTMCGDNKSFDDKGRLGDDAGLIPRILSELFSSLKRPRSATTAAATSDSHSNDYVVKCSFLELYNEELRDLLDGAADSTSGSGSNGSSSQANGSSQGATSGPSGKLRIYESKQQNGTDSSIVIQNLQEVYINDSKSGLQMLKRGLIRRKTASTKLNDVSSRSHTIFTINLYRKEPNSSEHFRVSKMNLVDLAGSENVSKSGAVNQRAKEAGSINQSLLTLGRVINCLSDRDASREKEASTTPPHHVGTTHSAPPHPPSRLNAARRSTMSINGGSSAAATAGGSKSSSDSHIPYRESKLTRLLQDSLGGHTKTALIATVSPAKVNSEETVSTLEYASRAKNIRNKPQSGQDSELMLKKTLLKDMAKEIFKLNKDLIATRNKNGVWLDEANYKEILQENDSTKADLKEQKNHITGLTTKVTSLQSTKQSNEDEIKSLKAKLEDTTQKVNLLTSSESAWKTKCKEVQAKLGSTSQQLTDLGGKQTLLNQYISQVVDTNVQESIGTLNQLVSSLQQNGQERIPSQVSSLKKSLIGTLNKLNESAEATRQKVDSAFKSDIPKLLHDVQRESLKFSQYIDNASASVHQTVEEIETATKEFGASLDTGVLEPKSISAKIDSIVKQKLSLHLQELNADFAKKLEKLTREAYDKQHDLMSSSLRDATNEIAQAERQNIASKYGVWNKQQRALNSKLLEENDQLKAKYVDFHTKNATLVSSTNEKISSVIKQQLEPSLESIKSGVRESKGIVESDVSELGVKITRANEDTMVKLRNIQNDLMKVKNGMSRQSPIKASGGSASNRNSPIKGSSPAKGSPVKMNNSPTKDGGPHVSMQARNHARILQSKIPQLTRTSSWEADVAAKKRKL